jgi:hypothetical protein
MPSEEYYVIENRHSEISDEEIIPYVKQIIEEAKKKFPDKARVLEKIEIREKHRTYTLAADHLAILIIAVTAANIAKPIILETWKEIVIPLLKTKLNIEPYDNYSKKIKRSSATHNKPRVTADTSVLIKDSEDRGPEEQSG